MSDMPRGRNQEVSDADLLRAGRNAFGPSFTAREVAERTDISREYVRQRLKHLVEDGTLNRKRPGTDNIYWIPGTAD